MYATGWKTSSTILTRTFVASIVLKISNEEVVYVFKFNLTALSKYELASFPLGVSGQLVLYLILSYFCLINK